MTTFSFTTSSIETITGSGTADTFEVNVFANFNSGDALNDALAGAYTDVLAINVPGSFTFAGMSVNGIEQISFGGTGPWTLQLTNAFAALNHDSSNNLTVDYPSSGSYALTVDGSGVTGYGLILSGGKGGDSLASGGGGDLLSGYSGADSLVGGAGPDTLDGGSGVDTLWGGQGLDNLTGGAGDDVFYIAPGDITSSDAVTGAGDYDKIRLADGGGGFDLSLMTISGIEALQGGNGADVVTIYDVQIGLGTSLTAVDLGAGVDRLVIANVAGNTYDFTIEGLSLSNVEVIELGLTDATTVTLPSVSGFSLTMPGAYPATVIGGAGPDSVYGGDASDQLSGFGGNDLLVGGLNSDYVIGGSGADTLFGGPDIDDVSGGSGADLMLGGLGSDYIHTDLGTDTAFGGDGDDVITDGVADGAGVVVSAELGQDTVGGNDGNDTLFGGDGDDSLNGNGGVDMLIGGAGLDTLRGGPGSGDAMWGEAGADVFVFASGAGYDIIADFQQGVDKIRLENFNAFNTFSAMQSVAVKTDYGNGVTLTFANGDQLAIVGQVGALAASDFIVI